MYPTIYMHTGEGCQPPNRALFENGATRFAPEGTRYTTPQKSPYFPNNDIEFLTSDAE